MNKENKPQRMRITMEANVIVKENSISMCQGGTKILSLEPIDSNSEDQQQK